MAFEVAEITYLAFVGAWGPGFMFLFGTHSAEAIGLELF